MRAQFVPHPFHTRSMARSLLFIAVCLQSLVVVNCAPSLAFPRNNGPPSSAPGTTNTPSTSSVAPAAVYNGSYPNAHQQGVFLRIGNGGAGQSGLIGALADAFIQFRVSQGDPPFEVRYRRPRLNFLLPSLKRRLHGILGIQHKVWLCWLMAPSMWLSRIMQQRRNSLWILEQLSKPSTHFE